MQVLTVLFAKTRFKAHLQACNISNISGVIHCTTNPH